MVKVTGLNRIVKAYNKYPSIFNSELRKTMIIYGNKMENSARGDHKYHRQSGALDRSIKSVVDKSKPFLKFWIDPKQVTVKKSNYGVTQHKYDKFMWRAWDKWIKKMERKLSKDMIQVTKRLGF